MLREEKRCARHQKELDEKLAKLAEMMKKAEEQHCPDCEAEQMVRSRKFQDGIVWTAQRLAR